MCIIIYISVFLFFVLISTHFDLVFISSLHQWNDWLMAREIVPEMTYNVSSGMLNPTLLYHTIPLKSSLSLMWKFGINILCENQCAPNIGLYRHHQLLYGCKMRAYFAGFPLT